MQLINASGKPSQAGFDLATTYAQYMDMAQALQSINTPLPRVHSPEEVILLGLNPYIDKPIA